MILNEIIYTIIYMKYMKHNIHETISSLYVLILFDFHFVIYIYIYIYITIVYRVVNPPLLVTHPFFGFCYPLAPTSWHLSLSLIVSKNITSICIKPCYDHIVGKGVIPPFSKMSPPFTDLSRKQKY